MKLAYVAVGASISDFVDPGPQLAGAGLDLLSDSSPIWREPRPTVPENSIIHCAKNAWFDVLRFH